MTVQVLALSGGVGGAKLSLGLANILPAENLCIIANTADDFTHFGLRICPDIDTLLYTLSGVSNLELGWGRSHETWCVLRELEALGGETWFQLGDKDLALHLHRTSLLASGFSLSEVTDRLRKTLGVSSFIEPMTDDPVATVLETDEGSLEFQQYFVGKRCQPLVRQVFFQGAADAKANQNILQHLESEELKAVIVSPSNPFLSIDPILAVPGYREKLAESSIPVVGISPIVGGSAIKGPAAKIMAELGIEPNPFAVASRYMDILDCMIIDECDADFAPRIRKLGMEVLIAPTVMHSIQAKIDVARSALEIAGLRTL